MPTFRENIKLGTKVPLMKTDDINDQAITKDKIRDGNVTTEKLADGVVKTNKISDASITTPKIADGNITTEKLKDSSVTTQKIANGNVTEEKIANQSVTNDKLAPSSVTNDKIKSSSVITEKINDRAVTTEKINDKAITNQKLDDKSVDARTICESNVQTRHLADEAVTTDKINDGAVTNEKIADGTMKIGKLDPELRATLNAAIGLPDNLTQVIQDVDENIKGLHEKDTDLQSQIDDNLSQITDNDKDISVLQERSTQMENSIKDISATGGASTANAVSFDNTSSGIASVNVQGAIDELNASMQVALDTKVDKEEGKSLIDDEVKQHFEVIENDEWLTAMVDAENHLLFGIHRDTGKPYFPLNDMYHVEQNEEFFALWLDAESHILMAIKRDGEIVGEIHAVNALKQTIAEIQSNIDTLQSDVTSATDKINTVEKKVSTIDASLQELLHVFSIQENPEFLAVETDAEQRILAYRDKDGVKHEHEEEVQTLHVSNLDLKDNSVNDIQSALIANGFNVKTHIDWSESSFIQIPEPRFAIINITNIDSMPTTKKDNKKAFLEFWDMQGNYFKKHVIANAQGNSSMGFIKKNAAFDFCDDEWIGDEAPKIRFGNWVPQDSFHMKAYYTDFFRGVGAVSYKLYDQIVRTRGNMYDRPWKKALLDMSKIGTTTKSFGNPYIGDYSLLTDTGARCFPDGFPVACYLNGTFYGIFSWQLKKHRDNYHMDKSTAEHVHLDGTLSPVTIFNGKNNIDWSQFEIRNPKGLYAIGGNKYDADIKQEEIAGDEEVNTWIENNQLPDGTAISSKIKKALQMTAKVKKYIQDFADAIPAIKAAMATYEASSKTEEDLAAFRKVYEAYFDVENMIDYMIVSDIIRNEDGFSKNWQWFTYDGKKWWVGLYDCDMSFGGYFSGDQIAAVLTSHLSSDTNRPNGYVVKYYNDDMLARYKQLADSGIISASNILSIVKDWTMRIGTDFYKEEYAKWNESPCIADSIVRTDYWEQMTDAGGNPQTDTSETFNATTAYNIGDEVSFGLNSDMGYFKFKCIKETVALGSNTPHTVSAYSPIKQFKHCDNLYRIQKWIEQNVLNMDKVYKYTRN